MHHSADISDFVPNVIFGIDPIIMSSAILLIVYAIIIAEKFNRAVIALSGACLMVLSGVINQQVAFLGIDFNTIALLTGMMLIVGIAGKSGVFEYLAIRSIKIVKAHPVGMLVMLSLLTAVLSALLDNVTTVLLIVPVTIVICRDLGLDPYPYLFNEILFSNIGGTATLVGDPPNIIIGSLVNIPFIDFIIHLAPLVLVVMLAQMTVTLVIWGRKLHVQHERKLQVLQMDHDAAIKDYPLLKQSLFVIFVVVIGFFVGHNFHIEPGTVALFGATLLLLMKSIGHPYDKQEAIFHDAFTHVEWIVIFFFAGLFIVVKGVEVSGLLGIIGEYLVFVSDGNVETASYLVLWASAILSTIIDNIPFVVTMIPVIKSAASSFSAPIDPIWWALSLGACLGGNGSLVGASANLTVAGLADRQGVHFSFIKFSLWAFPMMIMSIVIAHIYVSIRYF